MIHVKVPATTANIGPGFDTLGLAFKMYHEISVEKSSNNETKVTWVDSNQTLKDQDNYVIHGIHKVFEEFQHSPIPFHLTMDQCDIPASRGLGSSAAAYVSGIVAGLHLIGESLDKEVILKMASDLEGHPDNVAPAVYGGMVAACMADHRVIWQPVHLTKPIQFVALIPNFKLSTQEARSVMPKSYAKEDIVFNLSRLALLLSAFQNGDYDVLRYGTQDLLHQPYRLKLMPDADLLDRLNSDSRAYGGFVSGAGSTYMLICAPEKLKELLVDCKTLLSTSSTFWEVLPLDIELNGTSWEVD